MVMKFTLNKLLERPTYFHRVIAYSLRNTRFVDDFGVFGDAVGPDDRFYIRIGLSRDWMIREGAWTGRRDHITRDFNALGYINDFELLKNMHKQTGRWLNTSILWDEVDKNAAAGEAGFSECSDDYTKIMLFLNFKERDDFARKYNQYKISVFGHSNNNLPTEQRKEVVANIKKDNQAYLEYLTNQIYSDVFSLMLNQQYYLRGVHEYCYQNGKAPKPKDEEDLRTFDKLIADNQDVIEAWRSRGGQKYFDLREQFAIRPTEYDSKFGATSEYERKQNILYRLPQFSNLDEEVARCSVVGVRDIDYVPIFETFLDGFRQDYMGGAAAENSADASAQKAAN